ncbi:MAG: hypothetical protein ACW9XA_08065 [Candidatus Nitrosopumilus sp. bin_6a]
MKVFVGVIIVAIIIFAIIVSFVLVGAFYTPTESGLRAIIESKVQQCFGIMATEGYMQITDENFNPTENCERELMGLMDEYEKVTGTKYLPDA